MTRFVLVIAAMAFALAVGASHASAGMGPLFGFSYQWFRDADGDGIPNNLDDDWVGREDGTGYQLKHGTFAPNTVGDKNRHSHEKRFQYRPKGPGPNGMQLGNGNGVGDQVRLRLKDGSCQ